MPILQSRFPLTNTYSDYRGPYITQLTLQVPIWTIQSLKLLRLIRGRVLGFRGLGKGICVGSCGLQFDFLFYCCFYSTLLGSCSDIWV